MKNCLIRDLWNCHIIGCLDLRGRTTLSTVFAKFQIIDFDRDVCRPHVAIKIFEFSFSDFGILRKLFLDTRALDPEFLTLGFFSLGFSPFDYFNQEYFVPGISEF